MVRDGVVCRAHSEAERCTSEEAAEGNDVGMCGGGIARREALVETNREWDGGQRW